jgi:cobalt-zinc-cadmium efflux system protein
MSHDHSHHHLPSMDDDSPKNIVVAFWLNTAFAVLEIIGGLYTNSVAILSDAVHDLGDSLALGFAYYFHKKSKQKKDTAFSYGYKRFSLLGAFINSLILIVSSTFIIRESVIRIGHPEQPDAKGMIILAIVGVVVNAIALLRLRKGKSINEKVVSLHFLEDVLGWVAVLFGSVVMTFADMPVIDPVLSLLISVYILWNVFKNLRATFRIVLQGTPENIDPEEIKKKVLSIKGVRNIHDVHFWTLDGQYNIMTLHIGVASETTALQLEEIKSEARHCLQHLNFQHVTIEMELEDKACSLIHN